jgi:hypothetical protein
LCVEVVLEMGSVCTAIRNRNPVSTHREIAGVDASSMGAELVEVLLGHIETLLGTSHVSLVVGCEELIVSLFFDVWAGRSRASHFGSSLKMYSMDLGCRQSMKAVGRYLWDSLIVKYCERLYCGLNISYCYGFEEAIPREEQARGNPNLELPIV